MALVLTRRPGEAIWVGNSRIEVVEISGKQARLAVAAPPEVHIIRNEKLNPDDPRVELEAGLHNRRRRLAP